MKKIIALSGDFETLQRQAIMRDLLDTLKWKFSERRLGRLPTGNIDTALWRDIWRVNPELGDLIAEQRASLHPAFLEFIDQEIVVD